MSASCTISLDWNSADALIYGDCWIEGWDVLDPDDDPSWLEGLYDIARRDAEQYAKRVEAVLLEGPPRFVEWRDNVTQRPYFIWPVAVSR